MLHCLRVVRPLSLAAALLSLAAVPAAAAPTLLIDDDFERTEADDSKEQVGGGWSTNSKSRAKGNKQVDLADGAMRITRHPEADHGVSVVHEAAFEDAVFECRFQLGVGDDLGINIADMKEKSVHAGHICMAKVKILPPKKGKNGGKNGGTKNADKPNAVVELHDLKTGRMQLELRNRLKAGEEPSADEAAMLKTKKKIVPIELAADEWHTLRVEIDGETMTVAIDGDTVGTFTSEGIGHDTKSRIRLAVNKQATVDDVTLEKR